MVKDCEGKEINIGQRVVFTKSKWSDVRVGIITDINKSMVKIEYAYSNYKTEFTKVGSNVCVI